jgi:Cohesin domain
MRIGSFDLRPGVRAGAYCAVAVLWLAAPCACAQIIMSIPTNLVAHPGDTITIPVNLTVSGNQLDSAHGNGIASVGFVINYAASLGTVPATSIRQGSLISNPAYGFPQYGPSNTNDTAGQVRTFVTGTPGTDGLPTGTSGSLALIDFTVPSNATPNSYPLVFEMSTATVITDNNFTDYTPGAGLTVSNGSLTISPVPEPGSLLSVASVTVIWILIRRRRFREFV